jgi:hypothetical protein
MNNLLTIEQHFLSTANAIEGLKLRDLRRLTTADVNAQKKKFETSLQLSQIVAEGFEWYKSECGRATMQNEGISWTADEFAMKVYGYQKSFFYKLVKAGKIASEQVEAYKTAEPENRTIEGLLKFDRTGETNATAGEGTEGEGEGEGEGTETSTAPTNMINFTYKAPDGSYKVSVKVDSRGLVQATGTQQQILDAINLLTAAIK